MALQTPNIMRWTRYMDECLEVLDMSPASLASDKVLCLHVRLQHIVEDFELQLSSSPMGPVAVGVTHRASMRQLATWAFAPRVWNGASDCLLPNVFSPAKAGQIHSDFRSISWSCTCMKS